MRRQMTKLKSSILDNENSREEYINRTDIIQKGHFKLSSGNHSDYYINKDLLNTQPGNKNLITSQMAYYLHNVKEENNVELITGPAVAGIVWASPVADKLNLPFIYPSIVVLWSE